MDLAHSFATAFPQLADPDLTLLLLAHATPAELTEGEVLVRKGQFINRLPLIISGSVRVFQQFEDREILMYYVQAGETCTMSLSACFFDLASPSQAEADEPTRVLWLPVPLVKQWQQQHPAWNRFVLRTFHSRYNELLDAFNSVVFLRMEDRIVEHLQRQTMVHGAAPVQVTHAKLADELGTTRVVVSRLLKALEVQGRVQLLRGGIKFLK